jgi:membrane associated rhomboid family serine protease
MRCCLPNTRSFPETATYVTYAFLHGDIFHLGGNMLFLWVFGDNVEDALGHFRFLIFYLLCAVAGACCTGFWYRNRLRR